jgi:hypothetical protein
MVIFLFPATASLSMIHVIQLHCVGVSLCDRVALLLSRKLLPLRLSIKEFLGHSIFPAWVWPPGDARQIAREPVSCDSSVCMGLPIKGPILTGLVCVCGVATLRLCQASLGNLWARVPSLPSFVHDGFWRPTLGWADTNLSLFSALLQLNT